MENLSLHFLLPSREVFGYWFFKKAWRDIRLNSESLIVLKLRSSQIFFLCTGDDADGGDGELLPGFFIIITTIIIYFSLLKLYIQMFLFFHSFLVHLKA